MKQSDVVEKLKKHIGSKNVDVLNACPSNPAGLPDTIITLSGTAFFIEIKIGDDKPSKLQEAWIKRHYRSAYVLHILTSGEVVLKYYDDVFDRFYVITVGTDTELDKAISSMVDFLI